MYVLSHISHFFPQKPVHETFLIYWIKTRMLSSQCMYYHYLQLFVERFISYCVVFVFVCLSVVFSTILLLIFLVVYFVFCVFILFVFVLCLVYPMLPFYLDCLFLIVPSIFSNSYYLHVHSIQWFAYKCGGYVILSTFFPEINWYI